MLKYCTAPLYVNTQWICRIHISTSHNAKFERHIGNEHSTSYHSVFTVLYFYPYLMYHLYTMVNSLHHKYTRHCITVTFFNACILGVDSIANYSVLCADRFVFLASCWSQSLSSVCQSTSTKPLLKIFAKFHCSNNILIQPDRICQESANYSTLYYRYKHVPVDCPLQSLSTHPHK